MDKYKKEKGIPVEEVSEENKVQPGAYRPREMRGRMVKEDVEEGGEGVVVLRCQDQVVQCHQCLDFPMFQEISGPLLSLEWRGSFPLLGWVSFLQDFHHTLLQDFLQECFPGLSLET